LHLQNYPSLIEVGKKYYCIVGWLSLINHCCQSNYRFSFPLEVSFKHPLINKNFRIFKIKNGNEKFINSNIIIEKGEFLVKYNDITNFICLCKKCLNK